jgi:hypothetical protein
MENSCPVVEKIRPSQFHARRSAAHEVPLHDGLVDVGYTQELVRLHRTTGQGGRQMTGQREGGGRFIQNAADTG